ncbi:hypothetical protein Tco_0359504 [Tanacetum coccineum]
MSDSDHLGYIHNSNDDDLDMGSPGVEVPIFEVPPSPDYIPGPEGPPSPDYVPGPEEPEQAPPSPIYIPFVPEPVLPPGVLTRDDELFPLEEQPLLHLDSPTHQITSRADIDDDAEDEHLAPAEPAAVAYSADQDPYIAYRVTARMSIRTQAPTPFLSEEVAERLLALPTPPPSPLSPYSSPLPQIPSPPLPISSPPPNGPTYVEGRVVLNSWSLTPEMSKDLADDYSDTCGRPCWKPSKDCTDHPRGVQPERFIELSSTDTKRNAIIYSQLDDACMTELYLEPESNVWTSEITELQQQTVGGQAVITNLSEADYRDLLRILQSQSYQRRPVAVLRRCYGCSYCTKMAPRGRPTRTTRSRPVTATPPPVTTTPPPVTDPTTTTSVTGAQLQAMIDEGVH